MKEKKSTLAAKKGFAVFFHSVSIMVLAFCILLIGACGSFFSYDSVEYYFEKKPYEESPLLGNQILSDMVLACEIQEGKNLLFDENGNLKETEDYGYVYLTAEKEALPITLKDVLISAYYMERLQNDAYAYYDQAETAISDLLYYYNDETVNQWLEEQLKDGLPQDTEFLQWVAENQSQFGGSFFERMIYNEEIFVLKNDNSQLDGEDVNISNIEYTTTLGNFLSRQISDISEKLTYSSQTTLDSDRTNFQYVITSENGSRSGNAEQVENPIISIRISGDTGEVLLNKLSDFIENSDLIRELSGYELYDGTFTIEAGLSQTYHVWDKYRTGQELYQIFIAFMPAIFVCCIASFLVWMASLIYLICMSGHKTYGGNVHICFLDKWYLEFLTIAAAGLVSLIILTVDGAGGFVNAAYWSSFLFGMVWMVFVIAFLYVVIMLYLFSLIRRGKAGILWRSTFIAALIRWFRKIGRELMEAFTDGRKSTRKIFWYYWLYFLLNAALIYLLFRLWESFGRFGGMIDLAAFIILLFFWVWIQRRMIKILIQKNRQREEISRGIEEIRNGNLDYQVDTANFYSQEKQMADGINHIGEGLHAAVETSMKSERMKTDLITNVSHDIKTPLTSIINYVDLLKREKMENEKVQHYLDILDAKSQRLKNLTEDLVEASKASSGNIKLEMIRLDFIELVNQVNGEFKERLEEKNLTMVTNIPEGPAAIMADGRRLWRVLENLYGNVAKYAMEKTRVYIDVTKTDGEVSFSMKNISEAPLNISPEELTERFTRGDSSRTTEGSGLGLSIVKSLTELQKGSFEIYLDGDLFRATVTFPLADQKTEEPATESSVPEKENEERNGEEEEQDRLKALSRSVGEFLSSVLEDCKKLCGKIKEAFVNLWKRKD